MGDDLKKTKRDRKRISLTQKHEVAYMKKIAKEQIVELKNLKVSRGSKEKFSKTKLIRICKALLKALK